MSPTAVRKVEPTPPDRAGDRASKYDTATEFWALPVGSTLDGAYTFFRVTPDPQKLAPMFTIGSITSNKLAAAGMLPWTAI